MGGKYNDKETIAFSDENLYKYEREGLIFGDIDDYMEKLRNGDIDHKKENFPLGCKRFDAGWKFELGLDIKKYYVGIAYDLGLVDIRSKKTKEIFVFGAMKNRNFSVNVGYSF